MGIQWYAERAGATAFSHNSEQPQPGDLFVQSRMDQCSLVDELPNKTLLAATQTGTPGGRIMTHPAGFYSNHWGPLPWIWSSSPAYRFELWRIDPPSL